MTQIPWLDKILYKNPVAAWISPSTSSPILKFVTQRISERTEMQSLASKDAEEKTQGIQVHSKDMLARFIKLPQEQTSVPSW